MRKPRILLLADRRGWAFDIAAEAMSKELANSFDFEIKYVHEKPFISSKKFDLVFVYFWGENYHVQFLKDSMKVIKEISSHRWENEESYGMVSPEEMAKRYLTDAGHLISTSERLRKIFSPYREISLCPNGFDPEVFYKSNQRAGKLKIGWAGNINDSCKGIKDIIKPACGDEFELLIAGGNLNREQMAEFYNKIDVFCVASTAEGEPLTLIEAMACGCFPVCTDVGIVPELIENGKCGLIVERSIEAFREAFSWCQENLEEVRRQGGLNAEQMIKTRTWKEVAPIFGKMLKDVLEKNKWDGNMDTYTKYDIVTDYFSAMINYMKNKIR